MAIFLIIVIYMIISFSTTGGGWFSWFMLICFIITFIIVTRVTKDDREAEYEDFKRRLDEYKKDKGW